MVVGDVPVPVPWFGCCAAPLLLLLLLLLPNDTTLPLPQNLPSSSAITSIVLYDSRRLWCRFVVFKGLVIRAAS